MAWQHKIRPRFCLLVLHIIKTLHISIFSPRFQRKYYIFFSKEVVNTYRHNSLPYIFL